MLNNLRTRVLIAVLLTAMVPLGIASSQGYHCAREAILDMVDEHLKSVLRGEVNLASSWFEAKQDKLRAVAQSPQVQAALSGAFSVRPGSATSLPQMKTDAFARIVLYDGGRHSVAVLHDSDEAAPAPVENLPPDVDAANPARIRLLDKTPDASNAEIVMPVPGASGNPAGYLVARVSLDEDLIPRLHNNLGTAMRLYLYAEAEDVLLAIPEETPLRITPENLQRLLSNTPHTGEKRMASESGHSAPLLTAAARVPGTGWVLAAALDGRTSLRWLDTLLLRALFTALCTLLLVMVISWWISRSLGTPLKHMAEVAHQIREGNREARFAKSNLGEVQEVQSALEQMLDDLRDKEQLLIRAATLSAVGELTTRIVHEMRNPLSSIKMNLQAHHRAADEDDGARELNEIAQSQVKRLEGMLSELLQYGRPITLKIAPTTFAMLAGASVRAIQRLAEEKRARIDIVDGTNKAELQLDAEQMSRVLINLIENALQAVPDGSPVTITGALQPDQARPVSITVEDNGPALSDAVMDDLFKPFFTTKPDGVGLGLANAKKIVELHGGIITASQGGAGGMTFRILLPMRVPGASGGNAA